MSLQDELSALMDGLASAYSAGDAPGCAAFFTADAALHSPFAPPALGQAAIEALHEAWTAEPSAKRFELLDACGSSDLAWGTFRFEEEAETGSGTTLAVFVRHPGGPWRIRVCCLHGDTPVDAA